MENQANQNAQINSGPNEDARNLVETVIPSTEDKASRTTKVRTDATKQTEDQSGKVEKPDGHKIKETRSNI